MYEESGRICLVFVNLNVLISVLGSVGSRGERLGLLCQVSNGGPTVIIMCLLARQYGPSDKIAKITCSMTDSIN